jgi:CRP-like cAMP-binding protein
MHAVAEHRIAPLLDLDPDLAEAVAPDDEGAARQSLLVRVASLPAGLWNTDRYERADREAIGLLVVDGVIMREVLANNVVATELLGPGDVVRPWRAASASPLLAAQVRWTVASAARVGILDARVARALGTFPAIASVVAERMTDRSDRLAVLQAIAQLRRVDQRLLILLWHLAERWGRVTPQGVAVALRLSHRVLAQLVGARRPTVSTALGELAQQGEIDRRPDGTWVLTGSQPGQPRPEVTRFIPARRRLLETA